MRKGLDKPLTLWYNVIKKSKGDKQDDTDLVQAGIHLH